MRGTRGGELPLPLGLAYADGFADEYLQSDYDVARCTYKLLESELFRAQKDYVRRQIIYCLLQVRHTTEENNHTVAMLIDALGG